MLLCAIAKLKGPTVALGSARKRGLLDDGNTKEKKLWASLLSSSVHRARCTSRWWAQESLGPLELGCHYLKLLWLSNLAAVFCSLLFLHPSETSAGYSPSVWESHQHFVVCGLPIIPCLESEFVASAHLTETFSGHFIIIFLMEIPSVFW